MGREMMAMITMNAAKANTTWDDLLWLLPHGFQCDCKCLQKAMHCNLPSSERRNLRWQQERHGLVSEIATSSRKVQRHRQAEVWFSGIFTDVTDAFCVRPTVATRW